MKLSLRQKFNAYLGMTKRNILMFFKDKSTMFFSMLAPLIVFVLYIVFLKDTYLSGIYKDVEPLKEFFDINDIENVANAWLLAGVLGTCTITVALNSLQVMVGDKEKKIDYDYNSSPISGSIVVLSYFTGAFINTFLISAGILSVGLIVLSLIGNLYLTATTVVLLFLVTILGCASSTLIMMIVVSFFKSSSALGAFSGIISAVVGFVIGAYIPLGSFDTSIQGVLALIPGSHIACLYRNLLMNGVLENINASLMNVDNGELVNALKDVFALNLNLFTYSVKEAFMYIYSGASIIVALGGNILLYRLASKRS